MLTKRGSTDKRSLRTENSVNKAMYSLLNSCNFSKITVRNICETAQISRAAFYAHFNDKYDLLTKWLVTLLPHRIGDSEPYERVEQRYSQFLHNNRVILKNIFSGADNETIEALFNALSQIGGVPSKNGRVDPRHMVYYSFYIGGFTYYLLWQVGRNFPADAPLMNPYLCEMLLRFRNWDFMYGR